jgi:hypothetical protein
MRFVFCSVYLKFREKKMKVGSFMFKSTPYQ